MPTLTGVERQFGQNEIIVSKTDSKGRITYANDIFIKISGYTENELIGAPHNILRHPAMPRCIFKLLWNTIETQQKEIFAYVINKSANGDHYWVFAHITPSLDKNGAITGYHSNRRVPDKRIITTIISPLYDKILTIENTKTNQKEGMNAGLEAINSMLEEKGVSYEELIFSL